VRIFPESLRGAGEGQYPWDLQPDSVMTNATVGTITQAPEGNVIKVSYKSTESEYTVDPTTPIFAGQSNIQAGSEWRPCGGRSNSLHQYYTASEIPIAGIDRKNRQ
jgi:hypothetical protein